MILVDTVLVRFDSGVISDSSSFISSCYSLDLIFFLVWCMWPLDVAIDGGIWLLIRSIVKLGCVAK